MAGGGTGRGWGGGGGMRNLLGKFGETKFWAISKCIMGLNLGWYGSITLYTP